MLTILILLASLWLGVTVLCGSILGAIICWDGVTSRWR